MKIETFIDFILPKRAKARKMENKSESENNMKTIGRNKTATADDPQYKEFRNKNNESVKKTRKRSKEKYKLNLEEKKRLEEECKTKETNLNEKTNELVSLIKIFQTESVFPNLPMSSEQASAINELMAENVNIIATSSSTKQ